MKTALVLGLAAIAAGSAMATDIKGGTGLLGATIIDFEGRIDGEAIDTQYAGLTFGQDSGGRPMIDNLPQLFGYGPISGVGMLTGSMEGGDPFPTVAGIVVSFDAPVLAAGAWMSDTGPLGDYTITAFDSGGNVLSSFLLLASELPSPTTLPGSASPDNGIFVGFEFDSAVIASIQFGRSNADGDAFAIDDFQYVVPAPGAGLVLAGLVGGLSRRRR